MAITELDIDYLFTSTPKREKFRPYIRCEDCIYSMSRADLEPKYVACTVSTRTTIARKDYTCKSAKRRGKNEPGK